MPRIKRRTFSGSVCEQEVFTVPDSVRKISDAEPKQWFETEEDRARHEWLASRRRFTQNINATFSSRSLYSTLTLDNENEVHTFAEADKIRVNFKRRLQYVFPDAQIIIVMGRGKKTNRIHFHMLSDGISKEIINAKWTLGNVDRIERLRKHNYYNGVDHGQDYTGLAHYLFDHWTPEQGNHRWMQTKNIQRPEREKPTVAKRTYSECKPPRAPKGYKLVECKSNNFGYQYFKYVRTENIHPPRRETVGQLCFL